MINGKGTIVILGSLIILIQEKYRVFLGIVFLGFYAANSGGGDWRPPMALNEVGSAANYVSGAIGLTQIGNWNIECLAE